jgi:hypothetical protein
MTKEICGSVSTNWDWSSDSASPVQQKLSQNRGSFHLWDTHFSSEHPIAESALLWISVIVAATVLAVPVVVTALCMDLPADFACRELFRVDIPVRGIGCQCGYDAGEVASSYVLCGGPYHVCRGDCSCHGYLS